MIGMNSVDSVIDDSLPNTFIRFPIVCSAVGVTHITSSWII